MLTVDDIRKLKQANVSINGDLTKQRTKELLKGATKEQKNAIESLSGLKRVSINRVYSTGNISAKIAIAIAQTLGLDPLYLTGDSDEQGICTEKTLKSFLSAKGFNDLTKKVAKTKRKKQEKIPPVTNAEIASAPPQLPEPKEEQPEQNVSNEPPAYSAMTEDETLQLIRSLFIQGKYSEIARDTLEQIKALLVK